MNFGALAGGMANGLASGLQIGRNIKHQGGLMDLENKRYELDKEKFQFDKDKIKNGWQMVGDLLTPAGGGAALQFKTDGSGQIADPQQSSALLPPEQRPDYGIRGFASGGLAMLDSRYVNGGIFKNANMGGGLSSSKPKGFAEGGVARIPDAAFAQAGLGTPRQMQSLNSEQPSSMSLGDFDRQQKAQRQQLQQSQQAQEPEQLSPQKKLMKAMVSGTLDADKLDQISMVFHQMGIGKEMTPWLERAYSAKKSGLADGVMHLMRGQVDEAIPFLKRGGIELADRPTRIDGNKWKINIAGVGEQEMDLGDLLQTTFDPEKYLEHQLKRNESEGRRGVSDAQVRNYDASARDNDASALKNRAMGAYYLGAKTNEAAARAGRYDRMGVGSDKPEKIDAAIKRRDSALDALSSVTGDDGKPFVDPQKRMTYSSLSVDAEQAVSDMLGGRDLTAREQHALTDMIRTAPLGNGPAMSQWAKQLQQRFGGGKPTAKPQGRLDTPRPAPQANAAPLGESRESPAVNPSPGGIAQRRTPQQEQIHQARFNPMDQLRLKELHHEVTASNLTPSDREKLEAEIQAIVARNA
ncbi:hypothetical protein SAMN05216428_102397 [Nitrosospira sp. Nsp11]|uniref:hypothetical protein n=1 Tax=Nitrosospira sp. Nsp11 TaxID=1855338 RepID=UPI000920A376|nr:hypothetical protein [Nitrosospira sp. Nsp11]SHL43471.1 hypothetical protein SAMN05216428_102397 [Nitrosospira sp. Nsp11]